MKKLILSAAFVMAAFTYVSAQFEGGYTMTLSGDKMKEPIDMVINVKGNLSTLEMPQMKSNGWVKSITNKTDQTMIMLMDNKGNKTAMKQKVKDPVEMINKNSKEEAKVTKTGETKTIEGYKCEKWIVETSEAKSEMWVTNELGITMVDMLGFMSGRNAAAYAKNFPKGIEKMEGISLETNVTQTKNGEKSKIVIHDIKKQKVDDAIFSTEGYQMMDMPEMPGFTR